MQTQKSPGKPNAQLMENPGNHNTGITTQQSQKILQQTKMSRKKTPMEKRREKTEKHGKKFKERPIQRQT